ncbi:phosphatase PAP2 family protein [Streptomyces goshikiensis]|uniref:Phosphatase PAP2 family protein n=1 Tax=Streptomyces goshikiensis TaxID=1942 RepID=A0ABZ1RPR0_9ACTN|nr:MULTISPECIES: phosphatase PAP2 family protein [Streptomyces]ALO08246.1 Phosphoesterase PA-phosphatase related protein [Streptomyces venezuelae]MCX5417860.1 phosphatase PAP2 family protein [Streptomyces sp. NBC_00059]QPK45483.1 phosphatase PAP2 family protein [Streptomyces gardneri]WRK36819.1 phosphatase PAP2 family protein [Streptomyces venezuelae]CUM41399.1 putative integral membrane protein [Streptomyces venezuelae]
MTHPTGPRRQPKQASRALAGWIAEPAGKAALLFIAAAALTIALVVAGVQPVLRMDRAVAAHLHTVALEHPGFTHAGRIVTDWVVDPWTMRLLLAVAVVWLWHRRQRLIAVWAACTCAAEWALRGVLRWTIGRERPQWERPVDSAEFAAMPSGHAMTAAATCVLLLWLARWAALPAALLHIGVAAAVLTVAAACLTRVFLGVHWLTDTLAGSLLGTGLAMASVAAWYTAHPSRNASSAGVGAESTTRPGRPLPRSRYREPTSDSDI